MPAFECRARESVMIARTCMGYLMQHFESRQRVLWDFLCGEGVYSRVNLLPSERIGWVTTDISYPTSPKFLDSLALRYHICHLRLNVEYVRIMHSLRTVSASLINNLHSSEHDIIHSFERQGVQLDGNPSTLRPRCSLARNHSC